MNTVAFLTMLYTFVVDITKNGPTGRSREVFDELRAAYKEAPTKLKEALQPELDDAMRAAGKNPKAKETAYMQLGYAIKDALPKFVGERGIDHTELDMIKAVGLYLRSGSATALKKLIRNASAITRNPWVAKSFDQGHDQQDDSKLRKLVLKLVKRDDNKLTLEEAAKVRTAKPLVYKEYLALRREYTQTFKDALASFVRSYGSSPVPMKDVEAYMMEQGIEATFPTGFTGLVDDIGRFYTLDKKLIDGVPNTTTFPKILMNKDFGKPDGGNWVFMAVRVDGTAGPYFYTEEFKKERRAQKYNKVQDFSAVIEKMRKRWFQKVKKFDITNPDDVVAVVLEILFQFSARIGSIGNKAAGQPTYGVSTLLAKHAYLQANGDVVLRYKGKDGVATKHKILASDPQQKYIAAALHLLLEGKKPSERIFTYEKNGKSRPITAAAVNKLFKSLGAPSGVTVHKLRTHKATQLFKEIMEDQLQKKVQPKTEKEALDILKKMAMKVGKALNHVRRTPAGEQNITPNTALQSYIDPSIQIEFFDALGVRYPKFLEKLVG